jgi:hypothetical protein
MNDNKMSPAPWKIDGGFVTEHDSYACIIGSTISAPIRETHIAEVYSEDENETANAKAIVSAINNTYGKGIDPSSIPELLEALKDLMDVCEKDLPWYDQNTFRKAKAAIAKSIIK